jgi:hypothetical protein
MVGRKRTRVPNKAHIDHSQCRGPKLEVCRSGRISSPETSWDWFYTNSHS